MLELLRAEGFEISDRGMMRIRSKNNWLLRIPNGLISYAKGKAKRRRNEAGEDHVEEQEPTLEREEENVIAALRDSGAVSVYH